MNIQAAPGDPPPLRFAAVDRAAALGIGRACAQGLLLIRARWGLEPPRRLCIFVMTSWLAPPFSCASWPWRILLGLTLPLWGWRGKRLWRLAGGWAMTLGRRQLVGVKPPRLLQAAVGLGERIFVPAPDAQARAERIACHELTHACTARLRLPAWLNEGLAMATVDLFACSPTVRPETAASLALRPAAAARRGAPRVDGRDAEALLALYVRGYWRVRWLEETRPGLLRELFAAGRCGDWEARIAAALGMDKGAFRRDIDGLAAARFGAGR